MHRWKYIGCICLIAFAVLGAYFLPQMTSAYTDRRTEGKVYSETMQAFSSGTETETVKERSRRVMDGAEKTGMLWGDGQMVGKGEFRKRVKRELQEMKKVGLLPDVFSWKWIGRTKNSMTAYYWNLNENIEDFGDLGLWHICADCEDMTVELDMDVTTYKIYHVSIYDVAKKLDGYQVPKRENWINGFESYYEFAPLNTEKEVSNKAPLWENEVYMYQFLLPNEKYNYESAYGIDREEMPYHFVEGFSTLLEMRWNPEIWGVDSVMTDVTAKSSPVSIQY